MRKIFNVVASQIGWFACAISAARGLPWIGLLVVAILVFLHLYWSQERWREGQFILAVGALGMMIDSLWRISGLLEYQGDLLGVIWLAPLWIGALWLQFGTMLNASLAWLQDRYFVAFVMGAIFGPLSYLGGARLGALSFHHEKIFTMVVLGLGWGTMMPFLAWFAKRAVRERHLA